LVIDGIRGLENFKERKEEEKALRRIDFRRSRKNKRIEKERKKRIHT
jgi:hypothetical protein